jgi:uncharacterized protein with GYD domain
MPTYIALNKLTAKGSDAIKDTVKRADHFAQLAKKLNIELKTVYWGVSPYDSIAIIEAPNESNLMAFNLACKQAGFFTTETVRVFNRSEMSDVIAQLNQ